MSSFIVRLADVSLGYGGQPVLEQVSFSIAVGEFVALLGPNGAGKTTLLRGMLGLTPVLAGRVDFGFDRLAHPPGYVPQRDTLDPIFPLSAFEVVLMGTYGKLSPWSRVGKEQRQLAQHCLEQVGLADLQRHAFYSMSGGQKQRVLIARALAVEANVMFLDEPTAGVDHEAEASITELITRLVHEHGLTVVLVSHRLGRIQSVVQSIVWVDDGHATKHSSAEMLASEELAGPYQARLGIA